MLATDLVAMDLVNTGGDNYDFLFDVNVEDASGMFDISFYDSSDGVSLDLWITSHTTNNWSMGSHTESVTLMGASGPFVVAVLDEAGSTADSPTSNNQFALDISGGGGGAQSDIVAVSFNETMPGQYEVGYQIDDVDAGMFAITIYQSSDMTLDTTTDSVLNSALASNTGVGGPYTDTLTGSPTEDYLFAVVDSTPDVNESDESNNVIGPLDLSGGGGTLSDIVAVSLNESMPGQYDVEYQINDADAAPFWITIYESSDSTLDTSTDAVLVSSMSTDTGIGGPYTDSLFGTPTENFLFAVVDANGDVSESDEGNNTVGPLDLGGGSGTPDIVAVSLTEFPWIDGYSVSYEITGSDVSNFNIAIYESSDDQFDITTDNQLASVNAGSTTMTSAGSPHNRAISAVASEPYVFGVVDWDDAISESDETNNVTAAFSVGSSSGADISAVSLVESAAGEYDVSYEITGADAGSFNIAIYESSDNVFDPTTDTQLHSQAASNTTETSGIPHVDSFSATPTENFLFAFVDWDNQKTESDEGNNVAGPLDVSSSSSQPDIVAIDLIEVAEGTYDVRYEINDADATNFSIALYQSDDAIFDPADSVIMTDSDAGITVTTPGSPWVKTFLTTPTSPYLFAKVDEGGSVEESNESNNVTGAVAVGSSSSTDLIAVSLDAGDVPDEYLVSYEINGDDPGPFRIALYESDDSTFDITTATQIASENASLTIPTSGVPHVDTFIVSTTQSYLYAFVDSDSDVFETSESNNVTDALTIDDGSGGGSGPVDLIAHSLVESGVGTFAFAYELSATETISNYEITLYESSDGVTRGSSLGSSIWVSGDMSGWNTVTLFGTTSESHVIAVLDDMNLISETNENNNEVSLELSNPTPGDFIEVRDENDNLLDGTFCVDFGRTSAIHPVSQTFYIENTHPNATLSIDTGSLLLPFGFHSGTGLPSELSPGVSASGDMITFDPSQSTNASYIGGNYKGWVSFATSDPNNNPFGFEICGEILQAVARDVHVLADYDNDVENPNDNNNFVTSDPTLVGTVIGNFDDNQTVVEFDHFGDGTVDGTFTIPSAGDVFEYDPRTSDSSIGGFVGTLDIKYRAVVTNIDPQDPTIMDDPDWETISIVMVAPPSVDIIDFDMETNTGDTTDDITHHPILEGTVQSQLAMEYGVVELDTNGGGTAEHIVSLAANGEFTFDASILGYGSHTIEATALVWDESQAEVIASDPQTLTFELIAAPGPEIETLDRADAEDDANTTVVGKLDSTTGDVDSVKVYYSLDSDDNPEGHVWTNSEGHFTIHPAGLAAGSVVVRAAAARYDAILHADGVAQHGSNFDSADAEVLGTWKEVSFEYDPADIPQVDALSLANDDGTDSDDGITTDSTVSGTLTGPEGSLGNVLVELDFDQDGNVDAAVTTDSEGNFTFDPGQLAAQQNYLFAVIDSDADVPETSETNNASSALAIAGTPITTPDIIATSLLSGTASNEFLLSYEVTNADVGSINYTIYGSDDEYFDTGDSILSTGSLSGVTNTPGVPHVSSIYTASTPAYVIVALDPDDLITEFSSANNVTNAVAVTATTNTPDIVATSLTQIAAGQYEVGYYVEGEHAGNFNISLYASDDGVFDTGDTLLTTQTATNNVKGDGAIYHDTLSAVLPVTVSARTYAFDAETNDMVPGNWVGLTFFPHAAPADTITIDEVKLQNDTGDVDDDDETTDPTITGTISRTGSVSNQTVEINVDGTIHLTTTRYDGSFSFKPRGLSPGTISVTVRGRTWNPGTDELVYGSPQSFSFTLEDQTNQQPAFESWGLHSDTGASQSDKITANPLIVGTVSDDKSASGVTIEFDHGNGGVFDGLADGFTFTDYEGKFRYEPKPLSYGHVDLRARTVQWDPATQDYLWSDWFDYDFEFEDQPNEAAIITSAGLANDTGQNAGTTTDPTLKGTTINEENLAGVFVEFDYADSAGNFDGTFNDVTTTDRDGNFEFEPLDLPYGTVNVNIRTRELDEATGNTLYGTWYNVTFEYEEFIDAATTITSIELANDTSDQVDANGDPITDTDKNTTDPTLTGTAQNEVDDDQTDVYVEFDHGTAGAYDGISEGTAVVDDEGNFTYYPIGLTPGAQEIWYRSREFDPDGNLLYSSDWSSASSFTFDLIDDDLRVDSLSLQNDNGNNTSDLVTSDASVQGQLIGSTNFDGLTVEIDMDKDGISDGETTSDASGVFSFTPEPDENPEEGVTTFNARVVFEDDAGASNWVSTTFIFAIDPNDAAATSQGLALQTFNTAMDNANQAKDDAVKAAEDTYESDQRNAITQHDNQISIARAARKAAIAAAESLYNGIVKTADSQFAQDMLDAGNALATNLAGATGFRMPTFGWGDAPAANSFEMPSAEDLPQPPVEAPTYSGKTYEFATDAKYQDAIDQAREDYRVTVKQAKETLEQHKKNARDAVQAAIDGANETYRQNLANEQGIYDATIAGATSTVNLFTEKANHHQRTIAAKEELAKQRLARKGEFEQSMLDETDKYTVAHWDPSRDANIKVKDNRRYTYDGADVIKVDQEGFNAFQRGIYFISQQGWGNVDAAWEDWKKDVNDDIKTLNEKIADFVGGRENGDANDLRVFTATVADSQKTYDTQIAQRNYDLSKVHLQARHEYEKARAAHQETRKNAIATAIYNQAATAIGENISQKQHDHDVAIANATVKLWKDRAQAKLDRLTLWADAEANASSTDPETVEWTAYQKNLAQNEFDYWDNLEEHYVTRSTAEASADRSESVAIALADKNLANSLAEAEKDQAIALSTANFEFQYGQTDENDVFLDDGQIKHEKVRATANANAWRDAQVNAADAEKHFTTGNPLTIGAWFAPVFAGMAQIKHDSHTGRAEKDHAYVEYIIGKEGDYLETAGITGIAAPWLNYAPDAKIVAIPSTVYNALDVISTASQYRVDIAEIDWNYTRQEIDANDTRHSGKAAAARNYKNQYHAAEKVWSDALSDLSAVHDIATARAKGEYDVAATAAQGAWQSAVATADATWWGTLGNGVAQAEETYRKELTKKANDWSVGDAEDQETFQVNVATNYKTAVDSWDASIDTPWSNYLAELADHELTRVTSTNAANVTYVQAVGDNTTGPKFAYTSTTAEADRLHDVNTAAGYKAETVNLADDRNDYAEAIRDAEVSEDGTTGRAVTVANAKTTHDKAVTGFNQVYRDFEASNDESLQNKLDQAEWDYQKEAANLAFGLVLNKEGQTFAGITPVNQATHDSQLEAADATRTTDQADAHKDWAIDAATERETWTNDVTAEDVTLAEALRDADNTLAQTVYTQTVDLSNDQKNEAITRSGVVNDERFDRADTYAGARETRGNSLSTHDATYNTSASLTSSTHSKNVDIALADLQHDLHGDHNSFLQTALTTIQAGIGSTFSSMTESWVTYQAASATADEALSLASKTQRTELHEGNGAHSGLSGIAANETSRLNTAATNQTSAQGAADKTHEVAISQAEKARANAYDTAAENRLHTIRTAAALRAKSDVSAEGQYTVERAKAEQKLLDARAESNKDWVTAVAPIKATFFSDNDPNNDNAYVNDSVYVSATDNRDADYDTAEWDHAVDIGDAQVARAQSLKQNLVTQATTVGGAKVTYTGALNTADTTYATSETSALTDSTSGYIATSNVVSKDYQNALASNRKQRIQESAAPSQTHTDKMAIARTSRAGNVAQAEADLKLSVASQKDADHNSWLAGLSNPTDKQKLMRAEAGAQLSWTQHLADNSDPTQPLSFFAQLASDLAESDGDQQSAITTESNTLDQAIALENETLTDNTMTQSGNLRQNQAARRRTFTENKIANENIRENEFSLADKDHFVAYATSEGNYLVALAEAEQQFQLDLLDEAMTQSDADDVKAEAVAEADLERTIAEAIADENWSIAETLANNTFEFDHADEKKDLATDLGANEKQNTIAQDGHQVAYSASIANDLDAHETNLRGAIAANETANANADANFRTEVYEAAAQAGNTIYSLFVTPEWSASVRDFASTALTWWTNQGKTQFLDLEAAKTNARTAFETTRITDNRTAENNLAQLQTSYVASTAESERLLHEQNAEASSSNIQDMTDTSNPDNPTAKYQKAMAKAHKDYKIAVATADRDKVRGYDDNGNNFGDSEHSQAVSNASDVKKQAEQQAKIDFDVNHATSTKTRRDSEIASLQQYIDDTGKDEDGSLIASGGISEVNHVAQTTAEQTWLTKRLNEANELLTTTINGAERLYAENRATTLAADFAAFVASSPSPWNAFLSDKADAKRDRTLMVAPAKEALGNTLAGENKAFVDTLADEAEILTNALVTNVANAANSVFSATSNWVSSTTQAIVDRSDDNLHDAILPRIPDLPEHSLGKLSNPDVNQFFANIPTDYDFNDQWTDLVDNSFTAAPLADVDLTHFDSEVIQRGLVRSTTPEHALNLASINEPTIGELSTFWRSIVTSVTPTVNWDELEPEVAGSGATATTLGLGADESSSTSTTSTSNKQVTGGSLRVGATAIKRVFELIQGPKAERIGGIGKEIGDIAKLFEQGESENRVVRGLKLLAAFQKGTMIGFFHDGIGGDLEFVDQLINFNLVDAPEWLIKKHYEDVTSNPGQHILGSLFTMIRTNHGALAKRGFTKLYENEEFAKAVAIDLLKISAANQDKLVTPIGMKSSFTNLDSIELSEESKLVIKIIKPLIKLIEQELSESTDAQKAEVLGRIVGWVSWQVALSFGTSGAATALKAGKLPHFILDAQDLFPGQTLKDVIADIAHQVAILTKTKMCFVAGTEIHTKEGLKNIEDVEPGDLVLTQSEDSLVFEPTFKAVVETFVTNPDTLFHVTIKTNDGHSEVLSTTAGHPFYVVEQASFVHAEDLVEGNTLTLTNGNHATVSSVSVESADVGETFTTYNFAVSETHTYFAGKLGVWVHNMSSNLCAGIADDIINQMRKTDDLDLMSKNIAHKLDEVIKAKVGLLRKDEAKHYADIVIQVAERWDLSEQKLSALLQLGGKRFKQNFGTLLEKGPVYDALVALAMEKHNKTLVQAKKWVHAHHLVQKSVPAEWKYVSEITDPNVVRYLRLDSHKKAWYIKKSQDILMDAGIPLLDDFGDAEKLANASDELHNLIWAFNGNGTHKWETTRAVWENLAQASDEALELGIEIGSVEYRKKIIARMEALSSKLRDGEKLF